MQNYENLVEKITRISGLGKEEIDRRVEAKRAKLSGLISKEGAAQIIAAELGINFDSMQLKVSELLSGMKKANLIGKVISLSPVREFEKNGRKGKVANLAIADETGNVRVVLWDTNHIKLIEDGEIRVGDVIEIHNASLRNNAGSNELHLSGFSEIKKSSLVIENVKTERATNKKNLEELKEGESVSVRALAVQMYPPRFFLVCPECGKKATEESDGHVCKEHGKVIPRERALLNIILDDGSASIRSVLFSEAISKLIEEQKLKEPDSLSIFREDVLGSEFIVKANVKKNALFNEIELSAFDIEKAEPEKLIEEMEVKVG
jgi:ssDNA-binding replication factor A large subunit